MKLTLHIDTAGVTRWLHDDKLPPDSFTGATVKRVSQIEYDNRLQRWIVNLLLPRQKKMLLAFSSTDRATCLAWEANYVNEFLQSLD